MVKGQAPTTMANEVGEYLVKVRNKKTMVRFVRARATFGRRDDSRPSEHDVRVAVCAIATVLIGARYQVYGNTASLPFLVVQSGTEPGSIKSTGYLSDDITPPGVRRHGGGGHKLRSLCAAAVIT